MNGSARGVDLHDVLEQLEGPCFFIADVRSKLERRLLAAWLQGLVPGEPVEDRAFFGNLADPDIDALNVALDGQTDETVIIPLRIAWADHSSSSHPGWLRQHLIARKLPEHCLPSYAQPVCLGEVCCAGCGSIGERVAHSCLSRLNTLVDENAAGEEPDFARSEILKDPAFQQDLSDIAQQSGQTAEMLSKEAGTYIHELVPRSTRRGIRILVRLSRFVYTRGYAREIEFDPVEVEQLKELMARYPVALLCNHRSQVDSFSIYAGLFDQGIAHPHTFGGINMKMPVIGSIMRSAGMIFIRRAFNDNPVYKVVLQRYIDYLVRKRTPLLWSIEGGRSRTGKLVPPRFGLLTWLLNAAKRSDETVPVHFVPLSIVFEQVADTSAYTHEQKGGVKSPESLGWFFRYLRSFKVPLGKIHIRFGEPVIANFDESGEPDPLQVEKVAFESCVGLNRATPVTMASLICMVLLGAEPQALTRRELIEQLDRLLEYLRLVGALKTFDDNMDGAGLLESGLAPLVANGVVECFEQGLEPIYRVAESRELDAAYCRNNAIHVLFAGAIADLALASLYLGEVGDDPIQAISAQVLRLRELFKFEFFFPVKDVFVEQVLADLDIRAPGWREQITLGRPGLRETLMQIAPLLAHATLEPYLEAYQVVAEQLAALAVGEGLNEEKLNEKDFLKQCQSTGRQLVLQRQLAGPESIAKILFESGLKVARSRGLLDSNGDLQERRDAFVQEMREQVRQARALRSLASARRSGILR